MVILDYIKHNHIQIIHSCVRALKQGKAVVYPTDTSYGLAVDATNIKAIKKLYKIKGRNFQKAVSIVVPSMAYAKNIVRWNAAASKLAKKFWPGPLTLVLPLRIKDERLGILSDKGSLGIRMPNNKIALGLAKYLNRPTTATSANKSGQDDCYSAQAVLAQYKKSKFQPDIVINGGKLPKRKPSTIVKIDGDRVNILRQGSIILKI